MLAAGLFLLASCAGEAVGPPSGAGAPLPHQWRTEHWRGISVEVPADWAYGGAPIDQSGDRVACSAMAMVSSSGDSVRDPRSVPYVGRALVLTDVCQTYPFIGPDADPPTVPSVWLGADVEPGTDDLGDGWVRETVAVADTTVTVTSDDPALRNRILRTVGGARLCTSQLPGPHQVELSLIEGYGRAKSLEVCVYRRSDDGALELVYGTVLGPNAARAFAAAVAQSRPRPMECGDEPPYEWVTLQMTGTSYPNAPVGVGGTQEMVMGCGAVDVGSEPTLEVDQGVLESLRRQGLPAVLSDLVGVQG